MKKNKILALGLSLILATGVLAGCGQEQAPANNDNIEQPQEKDQATGTYEDGIYFAQEENFAENGWKYMVTIEVEDGKIVSAKWNGANKEAGKDKVTRSIDGEYVMTEDGTPWHEQAAAVEEYLLETQDPTKIEYVDDKGHVDVISGVSIHVVEFFDLAEKALANGPVEKGPYKDGYYHAEEKEFAENGWKYMVDVTVVNGNIVAASWNGVHKDGGDDKVTRSINGEYVMTEDGTPWHEQAAVAEAHLLETQDPTDIEYIDDKGHVDVLSGVSIHVVEFFELAEEALSQAK